MRSFIYVGKGALKKNGRRIEFQIPLHLSEKGIEALHRNIRIEELSLDLSSHPILRALDLLQEKGMRAYLRVLPLWDFEKPKKPI